MELILVEFADALGFESFGASPRTMVLMMSSSGSLYFSARCCKDEIDNVFIYRRDVEAQRTANGGLRKPPRPSP
jgi:hypothetical protein